MELNQRICIITGGGSGIGKATAIALASEGAIVHLVGRTLSKLESVKEIIEKNAGKSFIHSVDISDEAAVNRIVASITDTYGKIDLLINNAGHSSQNRRLLTTTHKEIQAVIDSNLIGTINCTKAVVPHMVNMKEGTIINVSSTAGVAPSPLGGMIYSAVKAAIINFTGFLNKDLENTGIRSSVVIPGEVDTPILDNRPTPPSREARDTMVTPEDTAAAILMVVKLPQRANIPELQIRPTHVRNLSAEIEGATNG